MDGSMDIDRYPRYQLDDEIGLNAILMPMIKSSI
jgi:hypothetical protein